MRKPNLLPVRAVVATVAALAFALSNVSFAQGSSTHSSPAPCTSAKLKTDLQINECLRHALTKLNEQMSSAVAIESKYLGAKSKTQNLRLATAAQRSFSKYVHDECTAQMNPYATGSIAPIIYGECALSLGQQRLALLRKEIAYFQHGGEAGAVSSMTRDLNP